MTIIMINSVVSLSYAQVLITMLCALAVAESIQKE